MRLRGYPLPLSVLSNERFGDYPRFLGRTGPGMGAEAEHIAPKLLLVSRKSAEPRAVGLSGHRRFSGSETEARRSAMSRDPA